MPVLDQVIEQYLGQVKVVFKHYPLRSHRWAGQAALSAAAAGKMGQFWAFHDLLFKQYDKLDEGRIKKIADTLKLDRSEFDRLVKSPQVLSQVRQDVRDGRDAGVRGTPTVFVNGRKAKDLSPAGIKARIESELTRLGKK